MPGTLRDTALSADDIAQALNPFAPLSSPIALAISGGPDSMALAFCIKRANIPCIAFIVDHGLRSESTTEAEQVKRSLGTMGIRAEILRWHHPQISGAIHEKARQARYDLLLQACHQHGVTDLLTAHHADDQAETILMRIAKGSAVEGLSGIAPASMRGNIRLLRPFLNFPKSRLIATCDTDNIQFVTDPSNASDKFTRGRLRNIMPLLAQEGLTTENLLRLGARASEATEALATITHEFLRQTAQIEKYGSIRLDRRALSTPPRAIGLRAIAICLRIIHPNDYPPEQDALADAYDHILTSADDTTRSLYGCLISLTEKQVTLFREPAAATEICVLSPEQPITWDGRWVINADALTPKGEIRALGMPSHDIIDQLAPILRHDIPQGRIRATLPALWAGEKLVAIPSFTEKSGFYATLRNQAFP